MLGGAPAQRRRAWRTDGGRRWWAHFEFTRINIGPTILRKKIEELMNVQGIGEKSFLKLRSQITVTARPEPANQQQ